MFINNDDNMSAHFFLHREEGFEYAPFDREMAFYESICAGDMELVRLYAEPLFCDGCGTLSRDPVRNIKYHFVVSTALIARVCIGSGLSPEESYSISDVYIMKADECATVEGVRELHWKMIETYTEKMHRLKGSTVFSKRIICAMEYISEHLHDRIRIGEAAEYLKITTAYLSRLFKIETGVTFTEYVNRRKIEEATGLLRYSEYSDLEISSIMGFSSQSYFIKIFKRFTGMTPSEYKKRYRIPEMKPSVWKPEKK
ncbi:MAG: AraC family transcriptional regulator [Ruminococcus sp.]|nr:AraC family transcriptional regulator [Ruminococcus sp.]MDE6784511.1 AraC family transcriptional regulator [Ruminococcus sp.]